MTDARAMEELFACFLHECYPCGALLGDGESWSEHDARLYAEWADWIEAAFPWRVEAIAAARAASRQAAFAAKAGEN